MTHPFSWIQNRNSAQLEWIDNYIERKIFKGSTLFSSIKNPAEHGYNEMAKSLKGLPDEAIYREASRQMKGAWNTSQYRRKNGNPVSLQISQEKIKQLKLLAKKRKQSQAQTLSDLISEALGENKSVVRKTQSLESSILNVRHQYIHQSDIDNLIDELMNEIGHRCSLEVRMNEQDPSIVHGLSRIYFDLVRERITEVSTTISIMQSTDGSIDSEILEKALNKGWNHGFRNY